jgi:hypothetical protein
MIFGRIYMKPVHHSKARNSPQKVQKTQKSLRQLNARSFFLTFELLVVSFSSLIYVHLLHDQQLLK